MNCTITRIMSILLLSLLCTTISALAQFTVSGTVKDKDGQPLIGATILIKNTAVGTATDLDGNYSLEVKHDAAVLVFSSVGLQTVEKEVNASTRTLDVVLEAAINDLEEVVITGLATNVKRSNLANSVASISAKELTGIVPPQTTDAAIYGKAAGVNISSSSGAPGGGYGMRLRGITSIFGNNDPLFVVDNIIIDNREIASGLNAVSKAAGGGSAFNQDNPSNRLADINPDDIENIEILKGASAAAIYGQRAGAGVVVITTKRGKAGKTQVSLSQALGFASMLNPLGMREWTPERVEASFGASQVPLYNEAVANGQLHDYEKEMYGQKGLLSNTNLSVMGGNEKTKFYFGGSVKNEDGIVKKTGYDRQSVRLNLDHKVTKWLDVSVNSNYIHSSANRGFFNNDNTGTTIGVSLTSTPAWAQLFPDENGNYPNNPYAPSNPIQTRDLITNNENINRILFGAQASAQIYSTEKSALKMVLRGNLDNYTLTTKAIFPRTLQFFQSESSLQGVSVQGNATNLNTNLSGFLVHSYYPTQKLSFRTQLGLTSENENFNNILVTATNINGSQTNVDQSANQGAEQTRAILRNRGFLFQEEFNFDDKFIATVGFRGDKSSANGDANKLYFFPKANFAVNLHEFGFLPDALSQLKLRAAYGEAGGFPTTADKNTVFNGQSIDGNSGLIINSLLGNNNVKPERQTETEFGADFGFIKNRITLEATYYIKAVKDLLLRAQLPTSSGYTTQVINGAELQNKGIEIAALFNIINSKELNWSHRVSFWKNQSKITRLDVPAFNLGSFGAGLGTYRIQEGQSATQIVGTYNSEDCGTPDCTDLDPDGDGLRVLGNAEPKFNLSFYNTLNWKNLEFSFLVHWKQGGNNINLSNLLSDFGQTSADYDGTNLDPNGQLSNGDYRINSFLNGNPAPFVEDAGYVRLREIGLFYNLPRKFFGDVCSLKLGFSGNNVLNFFSYNSYDPEVSNFGTKGLSNGVEVNPFPSAKRVNFHLIANF